MAVKNHSEVAAGARHGIHQLTYPDAANRVAGTNEGTGATPKAFDVAKQDDDDSLWLLTVLSPLTWLQIASGSGFIVGGKGTDIASANDAAAPDGNYCNVTGATQINTMATTGITVGTMVTFQFDSTPTVKYLTAGTGAQFYFPDASDFVATAGSTLTVRYDGTYWHAVGRSTA